MATVSGNPVGGDVGDSLTTAGNVNYGLTTVALGTTVAGTNPPVNTPRGFAGRWELEVPAGATVDGVRVEFATPLAGVGSTIDLEGGFLAADGVWPAGGFNATSYATRAAFPWPQRYNGSALVPNAAAYHGAAAGFSAAVARAASAGAPWTFGDGLAASHTATGIRAQLQSYLDNEPAGIRAVSSSGTALPIAFAIVADALTLANQSVYTENAATAANFPVLVVDFTPANTPPVVTAQRFTPETIFLGGIFAASGVGTDAEDGLLVPAWSSSIDGALGTGTTFGTASLSVGAHTITATVTDSGGLTAAAPLSVTVLPPPATRISARSSAPAAVAAAAGYRRAVTARAALKSATDGRGGLA